MDPHEAQMDPHEAQANEVPLTAVKAPEAREALAVLVEDPITRLVSAGGLAAAIPSEIPAVFTLKNYFRAFVVALIAYCCSKFDQTGLLGTKALSLFWLVDEPLQNCVDKNGDNTDRQNSPHERGCNCKKNLCPWKFCKPAYDSVSYLYDFVVKQDDAFKRAFQDLWKYGVRGQGGIYQKLNLWTDKDATKGWAGFTKRDSFDAFVKHANSCLYMKEEIENQLKSSLPIADSQQEVPIQLANSQQQEPLEPLPWETNSEGRKLKPFEMWEKIAIANMLSDEDAMPGSIEEVFDENAHISGEEMQKLLTEKLPTFYWDKLWEKVQTSAKKISICASSDQHAVSYAFMGSTDFENSRRAVKFAITGMIRQCCAWQYNDFAEHFDKKKFNVKMLDDQVQVKLQFIADFVRQLPKTNSCIFVGLEAVLRMDRMNALITLQFPWITEKCLQSLKGQDELGELWDHVEKNYTEKKWLWNKKEKKWEKGNFRQSVDKAFVVAYDALCAAVDPRNAKLRKEIFSHSDDLEKIEKLKGIMQDFLETPYLNPFFLQAFKKCSEATDPEAQRLWNPHRRAKCREMLKKWDNPIMGWAFAQAETELQACLAAFPPVNEPRGNKAKRQKT